MRTHTKSPSTLDALLRIVEREVPFLSAGGRAFITVPAESPGYHHLPVRSRAFRQWLFDRYYSEHDTIPSSHAFNAILHHLEAQAARNTNNCGVPMPYRVDSRGPVSAPDKILLDLANPNGQFVEITPDGWHVTSARDIPFETSSSTRALPAPEPAPDPDPRRSRPSTPSAPPSISVPPAPPIGSAASPGSSPPCAPPVPIPSSSSAARPAAANPSPPASSAP